MKYSASFVVLLSSVWLSLLGSTALAGAPEEKPCPKISEITSFATFGFTAPKGWTCSYHDSKTSAGVGRFFSFVVGEKKLVAVEAFIKDYNPEDTIKDMPDPKAKEPLRSIRLYVEGFLGDKSVLEKNRFVAFTADTYQPQPKGVLFSKNNELIVVYWNEGLTRMKGGVEQVYQNAYVFKAEEEEKFLHMSCFGCTPDEFFSLVVNPVIQRGSSSQ